MLAAITTGAANFFTGISMVSEVEYAAIANREKYNKLVFAMTMLFGKSILLFMVLVVIAVGYLLAINLTKGIEYLQPIIFGLVGYFLSQITGDFKKALKI